MINQKTNTADTLKLQYAIITSDVYINSGEKMVKKVSMRAHVRRVGGGETSEMITLIAPGDCIIYAKSKPIVDNTLQWFLETYDEGYSPVILLSQLKDALKLIKETDATMSEECVPQGEISLIETKEIGYMNDPVSTVCTYHTELVNLTQPGVTTFDMVPTTCDIDIREYSDGYVVAEDITLDEFESKLSSVHGVPDIQGATPTQLVYAEGALTCQYVSFDLDKYMVIETKVHDTNAPDDTTWHGKVSVSADLAQAAIMHVLDDIQANTADLDTTLIVDMDISFISRVDPKTTVARISASITADDETYMGRVSVDGKTWSDLRIEEATLTKLLKM